VNFNYNIPPKQRRTQQLVAQFNADEELWFSLESKRRRRRKLHPRISAKLRRFLSRGKIACVKERNRRVERDIRQHRKKHQSQVQTSEIFASILALLDSRATMHHYGALLMHKN
jgi:hypothetical protein